MNNDFPFRLKMLMDQLRISNAQLARGVNVDPSLISRWLRTGCGARKQNVIYMILHSRTSEMSSFPLKEYCYSPIQIPIQANTLYHSVKE